MDPLNKVCIVCLLLEVFELFASNLKIIAKSQSTSEYIHAIGINTKGQVRATGGIPGTGIYDTEVIGHVGAAKVIRVKNSGQSLD